MATRSAAPAWMYLQIFPILSGLQEGDPVPLPQRLVDVDGHGEHPAVGFVLGTEAEVLTSRFHMISPSKSSPPTRTPWFDGDRHLGVVR